MVKFTINEGNSVIEYNLPSTINEIPVDYFTKVTNHIDVAPYHSLVALIFRDKISNILFAGKNKKATVGVSPIFVKTGKGDNEFVNKVTPGCVIGVASTQLQLGLHVSVPKNDLSIDRFIAAAQKDKSIMMNTMKYNDEVCFVEFKVINNSDINFVYSTKSDYVPTFVTEITPTIQSK